ncbi:MAG: GNAT family N-acetyltransferase [Candidatus Obscuribacterales bacterium]|nr:GNAT family N-acetyltransferase [Candidatus Obscuribacterales bacterium]
MKANDVPDIAHDQFRKRQLLQNHESFLQTHRGTIDKLGTTLVLKSSKPEFNFLILGAELDAEALLDDFDTAYVLPWGRRWEESLQKRGYKETTALTYMELQADPSDWQVCPQLEIRCATTLNDIDCFSEVQVCGFLPSEELRANWRLLLNEANHRNLKNPMQDFFIGYLCGKAVGVCLLVRTGEVAGIYAVATLPEFRKRGISATLMREAINYSSEHGCSVVTLQVVTNSYAQSFYEKLGFNVSYVVSIFKRS